jgi:hypothetical protein
MTSVCMLRERSTFSIQWKGNVYEIYVGHRKAVVVWTAS